MDTDPVGCPTCPDGAPDAASDTVAPLPGDMDRDGLLDAEERTLGTDPNNVDSDGDGVTDFGEVRGTMTNPLDANDTIPPGDFFVVLPYQGAHENRTLRFNTLIQRADVFFLMDTSGSMQEAVDNVSQAARNLAEQIAASIPDVNFGVGIFEDFPVQPYGNRTRGYFGVGPADDDRPFGLSVPMTDDVAAVQSALTLRIDPFSGGDTPEATVQALYLTASGEGLTYPNGSVTSASCAAGHGFPCFRPGALPIVILVTDASFHNGPSGASPYSGIPEAKTFDQAVSALNTAGARVISVRVETMSGDNARPHMVALATATGSVDLAGSALVFDADGGSVSDRVIDGIRTLTAGTRQDVTTASENIAGNPGDVDATRFIKTVTTVEGYSGGTAGGYASKDATTFYGVIPGTQVDFQVDFHNDFIPETNEARVYKASIVVLGNRVARLDVRHVFVVVPPTGGIILF